MKERYRQNRLIPNAIEPRGVIVQPVPTQGEFTMWSATQIPHILRTTLTLATGIPEAKLRVIAPDVGGGFGSKLNIYAEEALCLALARKLGLPIKWIEERSEAYVATIHGRDVVQEIELAATADGEITAVRVRLTAAMGAYLQLVTPGIPILGAWLYGGCYAVQGYDFECVGVYTNTTPTDAYRGAGRPEATYAIERAVDALARKLGVDPVELRRKNFIREFPATIAAGLTIDSGDYDASLDKALAIVDYEALRAEQAERRERGDMKQLGIGFSTYVEMCGLAPSRILGAIRYVAGGWDAATIRFLPTGTVQAIVGTSPHGQGHVTTFSQLVADRFGVPLESVEVIHGDTMVSPLGMDTYGSRSLTVGGVALWQAAEKIIAKAKAIAAHQLEVDADDIQEDGRHVHGRRHRPEDDGRRGRVRRLDGAQPARRDGARARGDRGLRPAELQLAGRRAHRRRRDRHRDRLRGSPPLRRGRRPRRRDQPDDRRRAGARRHRAGGRGSAVRGGVVRRRGQPADVEHGHVHGSVGCGAAEVRARPHRDAPRTDNPLGVKGVGETGAIASPAAVMNAVVDALSPFGIDEMAMPATPERVWRALEEAR